MPRCPNKCQVFRKEEFCSEYACYLALFCFERLVTVQMPFLLQGVMLRNTTSKGPLAHLHNVMILLLSLGLITSVQRMGEGGSLSAWLTATSPVTDTFFFLEGGALYTLYRPESLITCTDYYRDSELHFSMCVSLAVKAIWEILKELYRRKPLFKKEYQEQVVLPAPCN